MTFAKITAIVRPEALEPIEKQLQSLGVPGMSASRVRGYGDYADYYKDDWMVTHVRIEVFVAESRAEQLAESLMAAAHTGLEGDGLVAISPVSHIYHVRTKARCLEDAC